MILFFDINIILDIAFERDEFYFDSNTILLNDYPKFISWHSVSIMDYVIGRKRGKETALKFIKSITYNVSIAPADNLTLANAFKYNSGDFEDAMQIASAVACRADFIITRDKVGYRKSPIKKMTPKQFLKMA